MMEVIKWDKDTIKVLPSLFKVLQSTLSSSQGAAYAVMDEGKLNIFAHNKEHAVYIDNKEGKLDITSYILDEDYNIKSFVMNNKQYAYFGERVSAYNRNTGYEESLLLTGMSSDNNGLVTYTQYDKKRDIECEIQYEHRYFKGSNEERGRIYPYRLENVCSLMIDEKSEAQHVGAGLIGKGHQYFTLLDAPNNSLDYSIVAIREAGLYEYLKNGAESIIGKDRAIRYIKGVYMGRDGIFKTLWPIGKIYDVDYVMYLIKDYGFDPRIPEDLIDLYNGQNELINKMKELLIKVKAIDKTKDEERCLIYSIHP